LEIFGRPVNRRYALWLILHIIILIDIVLISLAMLISLPKDLSVFIQKFDFCVCIVLMIEWSARFIISKPKKIFLKQKSNWIDLIASIPFDVLLPIIIPQKGVLRYLRLLKLLRIVALFNKFFNDVDTFIKKTQLDKIFAGMLLTILVFTILMYFYGPTYGLLDDFYFVIVTLTTVGYGDITPKTYNEKILAVILVFVGVFVFSTITAAISSYLTERLLDEEEDDIGAIVEDKVKPVSEEMAQIRKELEVSHRQNQELRDEIRELRELIEGKK